MATDIKQLLSTDIYQGLSNSNSPSPGNPFATMADVPAGANTIYSADDSLASDRTVDLNTFNLTFSKSGIGAQADVFIKTNSSAGSASARLNLNMTGTRTGYLGVFNATAGSWKANSIALVQTAGDNILINQQDNTKSISLMVTSGEPLTATNTPEIHIKNNAVGFNISTPTARGHFFETGTTSADKAIIIGGNTVSNIFEIDGLQEIKVNSGNGISSLMSIRQVTGKLGILDIYNANQSKRMLWALDNGGGGITDSVIEMMDTFFYKNASGNQAWLKIGSAGTVTSSIGALFHRFTPSSNLELINFSNGSGGGLSLELDGLDPRLCLYKADGLDGRRVVLHSNGTSFVMNNWVIGSDAVGASSVNVLGVKTGTAPTTQPIDMFQLYSADISAGNAAPHFKTESGDVVKIYKIATYTESNVTVDRSFDANSTTLDEVADVLGTLISDLRTAGFLG